MRIEKWENWEIFIEIKDKKAVGNKVWYLVGLKEVRRLGLGDGVEYKHILGIVWGSIIGVFKRRIR